MKIYLEVELGTNKINTFHREMTSDLKRRMLDFSDAYEYRVIEFEMNDLPLLELQLVTVKEN